MVVPPPPAEEPLRPAFVFLLALATVSVPATVRAQATDSIIAGVPRAIPAPPCLRDSSEYFHRPERGHVGPTPMRLILPPLVNAPRIRNPVTMRMHVTNRGVVDSVVVIGIRDSAYAERVRRVGFDMRFRPARHDGCLVANWFGVTLNFPDRR